MILYLEIRDIIFWLSHVMKLSELTWCNPGLFLCICCEIKDINTGMVALERERRDRSESPREMLAAQSKFLNARQLIPALLWPALLFLLFQANRCNHKMPWIQPLRCRSMTAGKRKRTAFQMSGSEYGRCALLLTLIWTAKGLRVFLQPWDGTFTFRQKLSKIYPRTEKRYSVRCLHGEKSWDITSWKSVKLDLGIHTWNNVTEFEIYILGFRDFCSQLTAVEKTQSAHDFFSRCLWF